MEEKGSQFSLKVYTTNQKAKCNDWSSKLKLFQNTEVHAMSVFGKWGLGVSNIVRKSTEHFAWKRRVSLLKFGSCEGRCIPLCLKL